MRYVPRRSAAVLLAGLVAVGIAGVTRVATAESIPTGAAAKPVPKPPLVRPKAPTGAQPIKLEIQLKSDTGVSASAKRLSRAASASAVDTVAKPGPDAVVVTVRADKANATLAALRKDPAVKSAKVQVLYYASAVEPNDPWTWRQWNLTTTGVPTAWGITTGTSDVTVAVIDSGVSVVPDLAGAVLPGKNFVTKVNGQPTDNTADDFGHGTMVASLLGANTDNAVGIAGACWTCRILPVKVLGKDGIGTSADVALGIKYAVAQKVDIINLSLGGEADAEVEAAIKEAVDAHVVVVAAAGNSAVSTKEYPGGYEGVISVGATDEQDQPFWFSNYGSWVSMAAPGEAWMDAVDGEPDLALGTSMAAPLVAGTAALIKSAHPEATDAEVKDALLSTTKDIGGAFGGGRLDAAKAVAKLTYTGRAQPSVRVTGPGNRLVSAATTIGVATDGDVVSVRGTVPGPDGDVDLGTDTSAPWAVTWTPGGADGAQSVTVITTDASGAATSTPVSFTVDRTKPTIGGATPAQNAKVKGNVTVGATGVSDLNGISSAALYVDGVYLARDTAAPYALGYNTTKRNGVVKLQWRITDKAGNVAVYDRAIIADNTAPTVKITSAPKDKAKVKGTVTIKVSAADKYGVNRVELLVNGKVVAKDNRSPYAFSLNTAKYGKKLKVQVRAYDNVGNVRLDAARNWTR
jgi:subtilisin family serine protease